jgi:hypothetical protein
MKGSRAVIDSDRLTSLLTITDDVVGTGRSPRSRGSNTSSGADSAQANSGACDMNSEGLVSVSKIVAVLTNFLSVRAGLHWI